MLFKFLSTMEPRSTELLWRAVRVGKFLFADGIDIRVGRRRVNLAGGQK